MMRALFAAGLAGLIATYLACLHYGIDIELVANTALPAIAVPVTIFTALYGFRSKWWANRLGKIFLAKSIFLSAVLWQATASVWIDADYPYRHEIRFAIYGLMAVSYWGMVASLLTQQRRDRRRFRFPNGIPQAEVTDPPDRE